MIYYLTNEWKEEDGGMLIDLCTGKRYLPEFNSLVAFLVPRFHQVSQVKRRLGRDPRFSVFGWFLAQGNIYKFVDDEKSKHKRKKRKRRRKRGGPNSTQRNRMLT